MCPDRDIVGFARLSGGLLFGHLGDRGGRKAVMATAFTFRGVSTGSLGLLPG